MTDETESIRQEMVATINANAGPRAELEKQHGQVWDTSQLQEDFEVLGFLAPFVAVKRAVGPGARLADVPKQSRGFISFPTGVERSKSGLVCFSGRTSHSIVDYPPTIGRSDLHRVCCKKCFAEIPAESFKTGPPPLAPRLLTWLSFFICSCYISGNPETLRSPWRLKIFVRLSTRKITGGKIGSVKRVFMSGLYIPCQCFKQQYAHDWVWYQFTIQHRNSIYRRSFSSCLPHCRKQGIVGPPGSPKTDVQIFGSTPFISIKCSLVIVPTSYKKVEIRLLILKKEVHL